jgi:hypothetical protein
LPSRSDTPKRSADRKDYAIPGLIPFRSSADVFVHFAGKNLKLDDLRNLKHFLAHCDQRIAEARREALRKATRNKG